ncbi:hemerythrin domain-containing protein [Pontibacter sp. HSC-36F09]|uniref:hemerythrin domain-containing protein n=1 Tax=Pontibacter sp. HSC-36F09 TaxID=2910966 RepID=UPI0020A12C91|nr:hemerythrin domain-containing protein [Pontibacter sp. HSC-36F09]MCP2045537.1 hemerythrin-like domain-containing protein [Pontibacter sp. HSC-36F09]
MTTATKPLKRDKSLVPLSREHHFGLLFCWKLKQGMANGTSFELMRQYTDYFWKNILKAHCQEEEVIVKRLLPKDDVNFIRIHEEHQLIEAIIGLINEQKNLNTSLIATLQQDLTDHIRWEERELFPYLQTVADPEELADIGRLLEHDLKEPVDEFEPAFWEKKAKAA